MDFTNNKQLQLAYRFLEQTGRHLFLTGKAGTGKTTFLHYLINHSPKQSIVVAPTGVAAINAGGVTIHSFFQLPFGPQFPEEMLKNFTHSGQDVSRNLSKSKINILRSIDLLIIDEISMVRADVLDAVDSTLRRYRRNNKPFGDVQLLMIGDLQQLTPIANGDEWGLLNQYYDTPYFFSSLALKKAGYHTIELEKVYRQKDARFIRLLNSIRNNELDDEVINELNKRYISDFNFDKEGYITLTTHNLKAQEINRSRLRRLSTKLHVFEAVVQGNFPEYAFPTDYELQLKTGTQVMFVKNDPDPAKRFFNGKIGTVTEISDHYVKVSCRGENEPILVERLVWEKKKYTIDRQTKTIKEETEGTFTQFPLKQAWAITIHKSQGLTFDQAVIDTSAAFAHGQVYVALSRCRSLDGLVLRSPLKRTSIRHDNIVVEYTRQMASRQPDEGELLQAKKEYEVALLSSLFDFELLQKSLYRLLKLSREFAAALPGKPAPFLNAIASQTKTEIKEIGEKFVKQLRNMAVTGNDVENNKALQERLRKASGYFSEKLNHVVETPVVALDLETDNRAVRKSLQDELNVLLSLLQVKKACLSICQTKFDSKSFLSARSKAQLEKPAKKPVAKSSGKLDEKTDHPELYRILKAWRNAMAKENGWPVYMVLPLKTIRELANCLPVTPAALKTISGLGKVKIANFGDDLLEIINDYCWEYGLEGTTEGAAKKVVVPKKKTAEISFELWQQGKTLEEIALWRDLKIETVAGHLTEYIRKGEIVVEQLIDKRKVSTIRRYIENHPDSTLLQLKEGLGDDFSYYEIKMVGSSIPRSG